MTPGLREEVDTEVDVDYELEQTMDFMKFSYLPPKGYTGTVMTVSLLSAPFLVVNTDLRIV